MEQYEKMYLYQRIVKAKLFIDNNYSDPLDLDNISDQAYFSKFHFIRLFKSVYGKTPSHYLLQVRMDKAKTLLTKGHSVLEASATVGFDSPTSFAGAFKKIVGVAPSVYQRKQEAKQKAIKQNPLQYVPHCFVATHGLTK